MELPEELAPHIALFSESQARALVSVTPANLEAFTAMAADAGVPLEVLGTVGGRSVSVKGAFELDLGAMREVYETALEKMVAGAHH